MIDNREIELLVSDGSRTTKELPMAGHKGRYTPGWVYLFDIGGDRIKIWFSIEENATKRLGEAKRWAPRADMIAQWPGMSSWETLARDFVEGQLRIVRIADTEQFTGVLDVQKVKQCLDRLFSILPDLQTIDAAKGKHLDGRSGEKIALVEASE